MAGKNQNGKLNRFLVNFLLSFNLKMYSYKEILKVSKYFNTGEKALLNDAMNRHLAEEKKSKAEELLMNEALALSEG